MMNTAIDREGDLSMLIATITHDCGAMPDTGVGTLTCALERWDAETGAPVQRHMDQPPDERLVLRASFHPGRLCPDYDPEVGVLASGYPMMEVLEATEAVVLLRKVGRKLSAWVLKWGVPATYGDAVLRFLDATGVREAARLHYSGAWELTSHRALIAQWVNAPIIQERYQIQSA
jgi:hypothetical protein